MNLDAEAIINGLAMRIAQLEVDLAIARSQIPEDNKHEKGDGIGTEIVGDAIRLMEVIDGDEE
jgi:hypothetical protein